MARNGTLVPLEPASEAPSPKGRGGRPPYQPDERTARQVEAMAGYGIPVAQIAKVVGVCETTLRKYYPDEIELGATKANAKVIESLFRKATGDGQGSVAAAIFWAKTRCGWRETSVNEHTHQLKVFGREPMTVDAWVEKHCDEGDDFDEPLDPARALPRAV